MKNTLLLLLFTALPVLASAQNPAIPRRDAIVEIEMETVGIPFESIEVFDAPSEGEHHYFLSVGHLGFGDEVVQVLFDPIFELFIPLGDNLSDAIETLQSIQDLFKGSPGTTMELPGCLAFGFPSDEMETVKISFRRPLLSKLLEFSLEREGYIRSAHIGKSDFGSLVRGVKFYHKLHPKK